MASAEPALHVVVAGRLECPTAEQLHSALAAQFGAERVARGAPPANEPLLRIEPGPGGCLQLSFTAARDAHPLERCIEFTPADCAQLPDTVALTVRSWRMRLPSIGAPRENLAPSRREPRRTPPPSPPRTTPPPETVAAVPVPVESPALRPTELPPPPPDLAPPPPQPPPSEPVPAARDSDLIAAAPGSRLTLRLLGGAASQWTARQRSAAGALGADWRLAPRWSAGVRALIESKLRAEAQGGAVSAWSADLVALGHWTALFRPGWATHLELGAGLSRIGAASERYSEVGTAALYRPCFDAAAGADLRLAGPVWLTASLRVRQWTSREALAIDNLGTVLSLEPTRLFLLLGLAWTSA